MQRFLKVFPVFLLPVLLPHFLLTIFRPASVSGVLNALDRRYRRYHVVYYHHAADEQRYKLPVQRRASGGTAERTLPKIKESAMMILLIYVILTAVEVALLLLAGLPIFQALNLALATMATGGFSYYHDSLISFRSVYVEIYCYCFYADCQHELFLLYYKIWRGDWASVRQDSEHRYYLLILTTAAALICGNLYFSGYMDFNGALRHSIFQAVSIGSTTGYASDDYNNWPSFSRSVLLMLMFIGGCSGSTAGGIKITRLVILLKAGWAELLRTLHPRIVYSIRIG